ncbi:hypothetical protein [Streptomyces sp. NPDC005209]|uniref:MmyB family transcriptional regulator n=1 Tax=Streptomyces sp. NPDC005209 TaxID=3156715 RepID=UPI0033B61B8B
MAQNPLNIALFGTFTDRPGHERNLTWHWSTSAHWRSVLRSASPQEEATSLSYVADLRAILAQRGHDSAAATLVADLRAASAEFADMWDRHRVSTLHCSTNPLSRQRLLLLQPVPGTPTTDRLNRRRRLIEEVSRRGRPAVSA